MFTKINKIKIIIALLGLTLLSCSDKLRYKVNSISDTRSQIEFKTSTIQVDNILLPYVEEFIVEADKYDIDVETISQHYLGVFCDETPMGTVGVTIMDYPNDDYTLIDYENNKASNKLRLIVFHEMGHKYVAIGHCHILCDQIMTATLNNRVVYCDWENKKKMFFTNAEHTGVK